MKKKILLIDDKSTIGKIAGIYLGTDYDFTYLDNPIKAIEWLNEGNIPDLIISDIRMPLMTGDEFLRYMKKKRAFQDDSYSDAIKRRKHFRTYSLTRRRS